MVMLEAGLHSAPSALVLFAADLFHPIDGFTIEFLLNGDMTHRCSWHRPMPMLLSRWNPDPIPWPDLLDWTTPALRPAAAGRDDQGLTERMRMPRGTGPGLEGDAGANNSRGIGSLKERIDANRTGEPICRSFP